MALHYYWWLLIWLFLFGGISLAFIPRQEEYVLGERCVRWSWFAAIILVLPFVIWAGWRTDSFGDTGMYRMTFNQMPVGLAQMPEYISGLTKDRGFSIFEYLFKTLISRESTAFFFLVAAIQMLCLVCVYRKYSRNFWLSIFLFIASTDYLSWMFNGVRQFLAAALIFAALPLLVKRKYILMVLVVLIASQIHTSALIFLPFIIIVNGRAWNIRTLAFIFSITLAVLFLDRVTGVITGALEDTAYEGDIMYFNSEVDNGTNIFRVLFYSVPAVLAWIFRPYLYKANDPMINVCANLSIVAACVYVFSYFTSGIIVGRLPIYFSLANYILIPWLIGEVLDSVSAVFISTVFVGVYTVFFYIQLHLGWGMI